MSHDVDAVHEESAEVTLSQIWPARNRFLFSGSIQCGPFKDFGYNLCLWATILAPCAFFFSVPAPYIWNEVSPAIVFVIVGLCICVVSLFLTSTFMDPGIIPRKEIQVLFGIQDEIRQALGIPLQPVQSTEKVYLSADRRTLQLVDPLDEQVYLTPDLIERDYKFCTTCRIIRPPRASHCSVCDNCVLRFDHHCPFINNCVGHRNYVFFASFIILSLLLGAMVLFAVILWSASGNNQWASPTVIIIVACVVGIPTALVLLLGIGLFSYHIYLSFRGQTTRENLTGRQSHNTDSLMGATAATWITNSNNVFNRPPPLFPPMTTRIRIPIAPLSPHV